VARWRLGALSAWIAGSILCGLLAGPSPLAGEPLGELEEPGEVERHPIGEKSAPVADSSHASEVDPKAAAQEEPKPDRADPAPSKQDVQDEEATTILPDSEAVDPTIDEEPAPKSGDSGEAPSAEASSDSGGEAGAPEAAAEDLHPEEATEILPDSEAVDESIVEGAKPEPKEGAAAATEPAAAAPPEPQWSIRWQNAFIVERVDDPRYQFLFGGRIQNDWGAYIPDHDLENSIGGDGTGVKFRRARLYFQGQFFRHGFFKAEYDFADSQGVNFTDVYAGLSGLPGVGLLRVGQYKEPFSLQYENSSNFMSFNERAGIQVFSPGRNTGIMLNGNFIRNMTYAVSFNRRTDDLGEGFSSKEDYHLTTRLTGLPYFEEGGARLLHVEFGYSHQFADKDEGTRYDIGVANSFSPVVIDTGTLPVDEVDLFNVSVALVQGPLSLQGETTLSLPRGGISEDPIFWGAYAQVSWWLTGEHRRYLRGRGVFSRVVPNHRFDPEQSQWGGLEMAVRYDWTDLTNDGIRGGTLGEWSFAINWLLFSNMRVSNNFVFSDVRDRVAVETGYAYSWVTRFEVDF
jgi:phosphate-selective porin OprO/OprP